MIKVVAAAIVALIVGTALGFFLQKDAKWVGTDEAVIEKFAKDAGRQPSEPFINVDQGDLLLFCFLVAGAVGGFIFGYQYRELFPPKSRSVERLPHV